MRNLIITILILFSAHDKSLAHETPTQEAASAYAFLFDSVIIKEFQQYPHLKDYLVAVSPVTTSKELHRTGVDGSSFWKELGFYYDNNRDSTFLDKLVDISTSFDIKKTKSYSANAGKLLLLDLATDIWRLNALNNTFVFYISNAVFTRDRQHCIIFYDWFSLNFINLNH